MTYVHLVVEVIGWWFITAIVIGGPLAWFWARCRDGAEDDHVE